MRVLHLASGTLAGGATRGTLWLHQGLRLEGVDSRLLTNFGPPAGVEGIEPVARTWGNRLLFELTKRLDRVPPRLYRRRPATLFSPALVGWDFRASEAYRDADVIHLHWITEGFVSLRHLAAVTKPLVWTLRDMWPMTGGCHYALDCQRYLTGCRACPQLGSSQGLDLARLVSSLKRRWLPKHAKLVGISNWISAEARRSELLSAFDVRTIPNCIDTEAFFPLPKAAARSSLGLATRKKIVLVGAQSPTDFYKGFSKALAAMHSLDPAAFFVCTFGRLPVAAADSIPLEHRHLGVLDDSALRRAYSAADVFLAPSIMEAFGKTIAEAMACATPVVCFDATGPRDIVDHLENGYRAMPFESADLARGIRWVAEHPDAAHLGRSARQKAGNYDKRSVAKQYLALYEELLNARL